MRSNRRARREAALDAGAESGRSDLKLKLVWLTAFRVVAVTLLLATTAARLFSGEALNAGREDSLAFAFIGLVYLLTLIYSLWLRLSRVGPAAAYVQVAGDVLAASGLVYVTGGAESPFTFTYSLAVVAASILLFERGALVAAAGSSVAFAGVGLAIQWGWVRLPLGGAFLSTPRLIFAIVSNALAQHLIAALASYLSRQLMLTGGKLSAREADLRELATLQRQILTCMPSGLLTCDASGEVGFINRAAAAILEWAPEHDAHIHIEQLLPGVSTLDPEVRRNELTVDTRSGRRILGLTVTPLEGKELSRLIVFQDLTELRRAEHELKRADQLAALGKLAAQLAHEIRNPLASMRGSAQMIAGEVAQGGTAARLSTILVRESDRLSGLVEDFLRFARPPTPQLRPMPLDRLIAETVEMLRSDPLARGVKIDLQLAPGVAAIDPDQLRQVLINLLRNAFEAAKPGGEVRVSVSRAPGGGARIRVWDSAGSIPPADLERIFEPFFTTREGGTGLGLSTAHSIIRAHGGMIKVSSSLEQGTEFTIEFPPAHEVASASLGGG